ncbi:hypothetical protein NQ315_011731 [Exocentrus adspersus]|uniref:VWFC domain-containing protein n=1 Tax=Exocentrus adspersus TaxID=1586481 RepID=A0AAV8W1Q4_9CUCU|nr:hypothetical protein NQ315_011731 [Exocentrus adspersus]
MLGKVLLALCLMHLFGADSAKDCDSLGTLVYEDLGCTAVTKEGSHCPVRYDCDDFSRKNDSCLFRGKTYALNQQIEKVLTYSSCDVGCFCENSLGHTKFTCAVLDCPEWLGVPLKPGCYRKFKVDECCSVGMVCPSEDKKFAECRINGDKFVEGEKFFPKGTCLKCVCDNEWTEKLEAPSCRRFMCNSQIKYADELHDRCAPCYFKASGEPLCCPDTWLCPTSSDEITKVNDGAVEDPDLTCSFGTKTLKLGEGFKRKIRVFGTDRNVQCECRIPPLLTCNEV